jgi:hypothetical protein
LLRWILPNPPSGVKKIPARRRHFFESKNDPKRLIAGLVRPVCPKSRPSERDFWKVKTQTLFAEPSAMLYDVAD